MSATTDTSTSNGLVTEHPAAVKELLKTAGLSERSELTTAQAKRAAQLADEGTPKTGEALAKAIRAGTQSKRKPPRYGEDVRELHAVVTQVAKDAGMGKPPVPKQTNAVAKALGDTPVTETLGLTANAVKEYARNGKKPPKVDTLREFIAAHPELKNDANLGPRKLVLIAYAINKSA